MNKVKNALRDMSYEHNPRIFFLVMRILILFLILAIMFLTFTVISNNQRTNDRFSQNAVDLTKRFEDLNSDFRDLVRADCPFLRNVYLLPNASQQRPPGQVVIELSDSARDAYYAKDCPVQAGPDGKALGTLPPLIP